MQNVEIVGSEHENRRDQLLAQPPPELSNHKWKQTATDEEVNPASLHTAFQELSKHDFPKSIRLPVKVIPSAEADLIATNPVATRIALQLSVMNRSVLFTGWAMDVTTISSNGAVTK